MWLSFISFSGQILNNYSFGTMLFVLTTTQMILRFFLLSGLIQTTCQNIFPIIFHIAVVVIYILNFTSRTLIITFSEQITIFFWAKMPSDDQSIGLDSLNQCFSTDGSRPSNGSWNFFKNYKMSLNGQIIGYFCIIKLIYPQICTF